jgi:hypothetical protein
MSDSPGPADLWDNPMGTDGFEFVEHTASDPTILIHHAASRQAAMVPYGHMLLSRAGE